MKNIDKKEVNSQKAPKAVGPYSQGIISKGFLYSSGQLPLNPSTGKIVEGGISGQTRQALDNLQAVLEAGGSSLENLVKVNVFLYDMKDFPEFNKIYAEYLSEPYPARSCVSVKGLPMDVLVEIEGVAVISD